MLITESTVSPFLRSLPDSPGVSVVYGTRSTFEGPRSRSPGRLLPGVKVGSSTRSDTDLPLTAGQLMAVADSTTGG
jgi:hypothetical protein